MSKIERQQKLKQKVPVQKKEDMPEYIKQNQSVRMKTPGLYDYDHNKLKSKKSFNVKNAFISEE